MVKSALFCFALLSICVCGVALLVGAIPLAAGNCITNSNVPPPKGTRWFYRVDRATNRKCLHLVAVAANAPPVQHTTVRPTSTNRTRFDLTHAVPRAQHVRPTSTNRRHLHPTDAPAHHAAVRPTSVQIGRRSNQLSESEQAALFQQFLQWKEQQPAQSMTSTQP
jgi:hypothetical protein